MNKKFIYFAAILFITLFASCKSNDNIKDKELDKFEYSINYRFIDSLNDPIDFYTLSIYKNKIGDAFYYVSVDLKVHKDNRKDFILRIGSLDITYPQRSNRILFEIDGNLFEVEEAIYNKGEVLPPVNKKLSEASITLEKIKEMLLSIKTSFRIEVWENKVFSISTEAITHLKNFIYDANNIEYKKVK